jgi:hypothetical protein
MFLDRSLFSSNGKSYRIGAKSAADHRADEKSLRSSSQQHENKESMAEPNQQYQLKP